MARTRTLAKALESAAKPADGSPTPLRLLRLTVESPALNQSRDCAYVTLSLSLGLYLADGSDRAPEHYQALDRTLSPSPPTYWATWPHAPSYGHDVLSFRYTFDAKDAAPARSNPEVILTAFEPRLDLAGAAVVGAERIVKALRMMADAQGEPTSLPEAISRLIIATEAQGLSTHTEDFARVVNHPAPPSQAHRRYRFALGLPDARAMIDDAERAVRRTHTTPAPPADPRPDSNPF